MLPPDYHMHTPLCRHATGEPVDYARSAREQGVLEIGFTDHSPMERDDFDDWRMLSRELDSYVASVEHARREIPEVKILLGLEVDYLPGHEPWIQELASRYDWDYFIGSVHYISNDWVIDHPEMIARWKEHDANDVWESYFRLLTQAVNTRLFDIIGHADLPKKFNIRPAGDLAPFYEPFLEAVAQTGIAIELNTAGLRKDCREIYPSRQLLEMAFAKEVPITFGSDAHAPEEVGAGFDNALRLARDVGYTRSLRFEQRRSRPDVNLGNFT